jgi:hypothetical protein
MTESKKRRVHPPDFKAKVRLKALGPCPSKNHFLVSRVIQPELPTDPIELVEIEAVFSKALQVMAWRELQDYSVWR